MNPIDRLRIRAAELRQMASIRKVTLTSELLGILADEMVEAANLADRMISAIEASETEHRNMDEDAPLDPGCVLCTSGATPAHLITGPCAHHRRIAVLIELKKP